MGGLIGAVLGWAQSILTWPLDVLGVPSGLGAIILYIVLLAGPAMLFDVLWAEDQGQR